MRILFAPHGTRGDIQPLVAVAEALRIKGHNVSFVAPTNAVESLRARGFTACSNGIDLHQLLRSPDAQLQSLRWQLGHLAEMLSPRLFETLAVASEHVDLIVGSGVQLAAASIAEWRRIPYVVAVFCPCAVPTSGTPPPTVRTQTLPGWLNRLLWLIGQPLADLALRGPLNAGRKRLGLSPIAGPVAQASQVNILLAADRDLAPLSEDAPSNVAVTDAWILEGQSRLDPQLDQFVHMEPAPLYVGFGSMVSRHTDGLASQAVTAARALGRSLILSAGWAELGRGLAIPEDVFVVGDVPHHLLFPHVAAVVHHGGAGTTTAAARGGAPQVILPHILDQYYWAHRVSVLGLGPRPLPVEIVNADVLTDSIATAIGNPDIRERAATLAAAIASRNGVPDAVEYLEGIGVTSSS
jgi:vancomycin aglycone glucosyltransferase